MKRLPLLELLVRIYPEIPREKLYSYILCREVSVDGGRIRNPKELVKPDADIKLVQAPYVSRGGIKLAHALTRWNISVEGAVMLDAGSSSGGFTDCLLQRGAVKVYAVDVGFNQLSFRLRKDSRVVAMEQTNIMDVGQLAPAPEAAVADLSFRSIEGAAEKILSLTRDRWMIALIKPQFEFDSVIDGNGFDGIIRDEKQQKEILIRTCRNLKSAGVFSHALIESPIFGKKGNREFLALLKEAPAPQHSIEELIEKLGV